MDAYGSVTGIINGKRPGPTIVFDGHIDTVPVPDPSAWQHEPYGAERVDGRIYGRGASDMKGAVAAMACAAAGFAGATKRDFGGRLCVAGVVHEECFEGVAASLISERLKPDYVIIGEASECNLKIGQRGRAEITVETFGVPAHSANPEKGVNAVLMMMEAARSFARITPPEHPVLGKGVSVLTDIISTPYPGASVVPSGCRATYDRRLLTGETRESVMAPYAAILAELERTTPGFRGRAVFARGRELAIPAASLRANASFRAGCSTNRRISFRKPWPRCVQPACPRSDSLFLLHQRQSLRGRERHQDARLRPLAGKSRAHHRRICGRGTAAQGA